EDHVLPIRRGRVAPDAPYRRRELLGVEKDLFLRRRRFDASDAPALTKQLPIRHVGVECEGKERDRAARLGARRALTFGDGAERPVDFAVAALRDARGGAPDLLLRRELCEPIAGDRVVELRRRRDVANLLTACFERELDIGCARRAVDEIEERPVLGERGVGAWLVDAGSVGTRTRSI